MFQLGKIGSIDSPSESKSSKKDDEKAKSIEQKDHAATSATTGKKKRSRGRRRKGKSRNNGNNKESTPKKHHHHYQQQQSSSSKKQHDAPMKKRDLYFSMASAMVAVKGGGSVVARVTIVNWDREMVLDSFVHVPVPVSDFGESGVTPSDIRKSNINAKSFAQVRNNVEKILCGKILIGHQLDEKLSALGLTHPITDVRDTATFFGDADLRRLVKKSTQKDLLESLSNDFALQSCFAALDLYKTHRKEWEEDLIQEAQERQKRLTMQQSSTPPSPRYYHQHAQNLEQIPHTMHYINRPIIPPPHQSQDNASWFVRGATSVPISSQPQSTPALSSRAIQALSSYSHSGSPFDDAYERASSVSYDGSSLLESSIDYPGSMYANSSRVSGSQGTGSAASWQEEDPSRDSAASWQEEDPSRDSATSSSSWFRFGSKKSSSSNSSPYPRQNLDRRMSAVCEEQEDEEIIVANDELQLTAVQEAEPPPDNAKDDGRSWFAFRLSKSPSRTEDLDSSRSHASKESTLLSLATAPVPRNLDEQLAMDQEQQKQPPPPLPGPPPPASNERSSSWFSKIRRAKSPNVVAKQFSQHSEESTESTRVDDDWLQEVMDKKPSGGALTSRSEDGSSIGQAPNSGSSTTAWFRFLRSPRSPKSSRSRLLSLDNELSSNELRLQPGESFEEDSSNVWVGEPIVRDQINFEGRGDDNDWNETASAHSRGLFLPPARTRLPTESTIPSVGTDDLDDDESSMPNDILEGMEQNLAFLNI